MGLFSAASVEKINKIAAKSKESLQASQPVNARSMNDDLHKMSLQVMEYFKDSPAILITNKEELHNYVDKCIEVGYAGIDTETTGLDRIHDWIVGASLYTPGLPECYIPMKHIVPIFDTPYKDQLSYEEVGEEFQRLVDNKVKLIFANADFDLAMIYKDLKVDMIPAFYYDVISAWRCIKENELDNTLKGLYAKYPMKGKVDPKKFSDFFSPKLFPYCKPKVAKLYAANDAKITYELFLWQLPYVNPNHEKCKEKHLEKIANLVWNIEFPMVASCALLHRRGLYLDDSITQILHTRYTEHLHKDEKELAQLIQDLIDIKDVASNKNRPFRTGSDFNPNSNPHVKYLVNNLLGKTAKSTGKDILKEINQPATNKVLDVRGDVKLLGTYVDKMPKVIAKDHRVHACFKALGAATGRMCIAEGQYVNTVNEGHKKIENIVPGDIVFCYDEKSDKIVQSEVINTWQTGQNKECVVIKYSNSDPSKLSASRWLRCTPEHLIYTKNEGWKEARLLNPGDQVLYTSMTGSLIHPEDGFSQVELKDYTIDSVTKAEKQYNVYDIEVGGYHNFFAANILVHNSSDAPNLQNIPSKAHDIRHMFRATPELKEEISLNQKEDETTFITTLSNYDSIPTTEGLKKVKDLTTDDIVIVNDNKNKVNCKIKSIELKSGESTISFELLEEGGQL